MENYFKCILCSSVMSELKKLFQKDKHNISGFPDFLQRQVFSWIKRCVLECTPRPYVSNTRYTVIDDRFNELICAEFQEHLGDTLEEHLRSIAGNREKTAEYINYLLQKYSNEDLALQLEDILRCARSEFKVVIQRTPSENIAYSAPTQDIISSYSVSIFLEFRTDRIFSDQMQILRNERIKDAWSDFYSLRSDYNGTVQKSLDAVAGAIRDSLYPKDSTTNLSDYSNRIEKGIDTLALPNKDKINWVSIVKSLAEHVNTRGVHNSGSDSDATRSQAHTVLHLSIAVIAMLEDT